MLGAGGASMIGKDPHHRANRKFRRGRLSAGAPGQNAMFLIGVDHDQVGDRIAREIANHAIALIDRETRGARSRDIAIQPASTMIQPLSR
jgi:hypothetical protein